MLFTPLVFEALASKSWKRYELLSGVRASGGTLFIAGILIILGAFISRMTLIFILLSSLFYLPYEIYRTFSMIVDVVPNESLVIAPIAEIVIGLLSLFVFINLSNKRNINV